MRIESYTLPIVASVVFIGVLSFNIIGGLSPSRVAFDANDPFSQSAGNSSNLSDSLVAYWPFDEGEGVTALDFSAKGNTGILKGHPKWVPGISRSALFLNGIDDYVEVSASAYLSLSKGFSFSAWVLPSKLSKQSVVLSKSGMSDSGEGEYTVSLGKDGSVRFSASGIANIWISSAYVKPEQWVHVAVTYDSKVAPNSRLYINGVHVLSGDIPTFLGEDSSSFLIGKGGEGEYFNGLIDEVRVYGHALSPEEVQQLFEIGSSKVDGSAKDSSPATAYFPNNPILELFSEMSKGVHSILIK